MEGTEVPKSVRPSYLSLATFVPRITPSKIFPFSTSTEQNTQPAVCLVWSATIAAQPNTVHGIWYRNRLQLVEKEQRQPPHLSWQERITPLSSHPSQQRAQHSLTHILSLNPSCHRKGGKRPQVRDFRSEEGSQPPTCPWCCF